MNPGKRLSPLKDFLRKEYFEPDISRAIFVTVALIVPLGIAYYLQKPFLGIFVSITSQLITSAKIQGSYVEKASALIIGTFSIAAASFAGTLAGGNMITAALFIALVTGIAALARGIGDHAQTFGISAVILFLISLHSPNTLFSALERMELVVAGGLWASLLVLFHWPFNPNRPFYIAISKPWYLTGELMVAAAAGPQADTKLSWILKIALRNFYSAEQKEIDLRKALNEVLPWIKKKRRKTAPIRREALKIVRASSRFGATALAIQNEIENLDQSDYKLVAPLFQSVANSLNGATFLITRAIIKQSEKNIERLTAQIVEAEKEIELLSLQVAELPSKNPFPLVHIVSLFDSSAQYLHDALLMLSRMRKNKSNAPHRIENKSLSEIRNFWSKVLVQLQPDSLLFRHALRVMIVSAIGILLYYSFRIPRGYWIVLTTAILLQPEFGATIEKAKDRLWGTILGGILGSMLLFVSSFYHYSFLMTSIALSSFMFIYLQAKNYKIAVVFVTLMLVAMLDLSEDVDWHIAAYRLLSTGIGCLFGVGAAYLLWPEWDRAHFNERMAKAILANQKYLEQVAHELKFNKGFHSRVIGDRRKAEVENINIQDSLKRLRQESEFLRKEILNADRLVEHNKKLTREITSFSVILPELEGVEFPEVVTLIEVLSQELGRIGDSFKNEQPFFSSGVKYYLDKLDTNLENDISVFAGTDKQKFLKVKLELSRIVKEIEQLSKISAEIWQNSGGDLQA